MAGFLRKVAGAFVYLEDGTEKPTGSTEGGSVEQIALETNELIAQLGRSRPETVDRAADKSVVTRPGDPQVMQTMQMTADEVFAAGGIPDGANSAQRVLKIIAGLSMFPRDQQAVMLRAMDAADETWSEKDVLQDARRRQSALRNHLQAIDAERAQKSQSIAVKLEKAEADGKRRLNDIDQQLTELQKLRQEAVAATTSALSELDLEKKQTDEAAEKARRGITVVINALSELITFFTGGETKPVAKP